MPSTPTSKSPLVLPPLLKQLATDYYDSDEMDELPDELPRYDLLSLAQVLIQRQERGRRLDPSDPDYNVQILALEDEAAFFKQLYGCWWSEYKQKRFESELRAARYA